MYLKYKKKDSAAGYFALDYGYGKTDTDVLLYTTVGFKQLYFVRKIPCVRIVSSQSENYKVRKAQK